MRLKPVENTPEPEYPDYEGFHQDRRDFLRRLGALAASLLAAPVISGCGKKEPPVRLGGAVAAPQPPKDAAKPTPPPVSPERLRGEVVAPAPIPKPPEPRIAGGMRAPDSPDDIELKEDPDSPEVPDSPAPPKESPK